MNSQECPETEVPVVRKLEVLQFISILKWKENKIFQYFRIKEEEGGHSQWRERSFFKGRGGTGVCLTVL